MAPDSYTELFFLDEVTALAAGHRPCFECRRRDAEAFRTAFGGSASASSMDAVLHRERLDGRAKRTHTARWDDLPDGAMAVVEGAFLARHDRRALRFAFDGWKPVRAPAGSVAVLTPASAVDALREGYRPLWHPDLEARRGDP